MEVLDITNQKVLEQIISKYSIKVSEADTKSKQTAKDLSESIDYYRTHNEEEIISDIKAEAFEKISSLDDNNALRLAAISKFAKESNKKIPDEYIKSTINKLSEDRKKQLIKEYKTETFNTYVNKKVNSMRKNNNFWFYMTDEQKKKYVSLYKDFSLAKDLLDARISAIKETADENGVLPPSCITNMKPVDKIANRVIKIEDQDKQDRIVAGGIKEKITRLFNDLQKNMGPTAIEIGICQIFVPFIGYMVNALYERKDATIKAIIATEAVIIAGAVISFNSDTIRDFFKDQKTIEEAKKLGILDLLINCGRANMKFASYTKKLEKEYGTINEIVNGGNNGLH